MSETGYSFLYSLVSSSLGGIGPVRMEELSSQVPGANLVISGEGKESPSIILRSEEEWQTVAIALETSEGLTRLRNIMNMRGSQVPKSLLTLMGDLDPRFKTKLQSKKETPSGPTYIDVKSYVSRKVDAALMGQLLVEAEALKQEGFKARRTGRSFSPSLSLAHLQIEVGNPQLLDLVTQLRPLYDLVMNLRSVAAAPLPRIDAARQEINGYREFVRMLNEARRLESISPEERRSIEKKWRDDPGSRSSITEELSRLLHG